MKKALCFAGGMLLAAAVLIYSVLLPAAQTALFERALIAHVDGYASGELAAFAADTMAYLHGQTDEWSPRIPQGGVSDAFRAHMAEVRRGALALPWIIAGAGGAGLALLLMGRWQRRCALWGVAALAAVVASVLIWAAVDFSSFWMVIHRLFIPGGIFPSGEPVMQLFPLDVFFSYAAPVCLSAALHMAALCATLFSLRRERKET